MPHRIASSIAAGHVLDVFGDGLDQSGVAYSLWDAEDKLVAYNDIYVRMFFTGFEQLVELGQTFERQNARWGEHKAKMIQVSDLNEQVAERLKRHREPKASFERRIDDRWIRSKEIATDDGGLLSIHTDITHEKERENAAREGERRFRSLVENLHNIMFCRGVKGDGAYGYDAAGLQVYGKDSERMLGAVDSSGTSKIADWYGSIHPEDRARYNLLEAARKNDGQPYDLEFRFLHPATGQLRWVREVAW